LRANDFFPANQKLVAKVFIDRFLSIRFEVMSLWILSAGGRLACWHHWHVMTLSNGQIDCRQEPEREQ